MNTIKSLIPLELKKFIYRNFPPFNFSIPNKEIPPDLNISVSDCFLFRGKEYETIFIAENNLMTLLLEPIECLHTLLFFNESGIIKKITKSSNERSVAFELSKERDNETGPLNVSINDLDGCNFIHQISYSPEDIAKAKEFIKSGATLQTRGYTGYRKVGQKLYTYVHGNFGGLFFKDNKIESSSLQRVFHSYTPQFRFEPNFEYEFFFQNPTPKKLDFKIINRTNSSVIFNDSIPALGFTVKKMTVNEPSTFSWKSKLPIGRALIFERNLTSGHLDVFHS